MMLGFLTLSLGVLAAPTASDSGYGALALLRGRHDLAERQLVARQAIEPGEPSVLLNLAYLYEQTGRDAEARSAYRAVLAGDNVLMDLASGRTAWSHDLAKARLERASFASR